MATTSNIRIKVAVNGATVDYFVPSNSTTSSLSASATFKEDLGLGQNIRILVNGAETTRRLVAGDLLTVQTVASQKAAGRIQIRVLANGNTVNYFVNHGTTAGSLNTATFREDIGLGQNFRVLVNGVEVPSTTRLEANDLITVQTVASQKAAGRIQIRVQANGNTTNYFVNHGTTAGSLNTATFREDIGLGQNFRVLVNGVEVPSGTRLEANDLITVQTVASQKAA